MGIQIRSERAVGPHEARPEDVCPMHEQRHRHDPEPDLDPHISPPPGAGEIWGSRSDLNALSVHTKRAPRTFAPCMSSGTATIPSPIWIPISRRRPALARYGDPDQI